MSSNNNYKGLVLRIAVGFAALMIFLFASGAGVIYAAGETPPPPPSVTDTSTPPPPPTITSTLTPPPPPSETASPPESIEIRGDVNRNIKIDIGDATVILRYVVGLSVPSQYLPLLPRGDLNCNDKIDIGDATMILRSVVGLPIPKCWE